MKKIYCGIHAENIVGLFLKVIIELLLLYQNINRNFLVPEHAVDPIIE